MSLIKKTPRAEEDLIGIWIYIARESVVSADKVCTAIEGTLKTLASCSKIGTMYSSVNPQLSNVRFFPTRHYPKYLIFYRPIRNGIKVIRVLHSARDIENIL